MPATLKNCGVVPFQNWNYLTGHLAPGVISQCQDKNYAPSCSSVLGTMKKGLLESAFAFTSRWEIDTQVVFAVHILFLYGHSGLLVSLDVYPRLWSLSENAGGCFTGCKNRRHGMLWKPLIRFSSNASCVFLLPKHFDICWLSQWVTSLLMLG